VSGLVDGPLLGELGRSQVAERRVWPEPVVVDPTVLGQDLRFEKGFEDLAVEKLVPEFAVGTGTSVASTRSI